MRKLIYTTLFFVMLTQLTVGQSLTQTVRGAIIDADSKMPLIGVAVAIVEAEPIIGTVTDIDGNFRLENVPVGRITLQLSYLGYETKTIPNVEINSGKEVVLDLNMQESLIKIDEIVVQANKRKGQAINDMSLLSARSISIEESRRFVGGFNDPSRVVANFAGVTSSPDGSSDIIVRGNAPKYIQWRIEGTEITSPYHFDDQNASFGGLSTINNNLLTTSDFYTGAFSPEYGNVLSSVFDVKLRPGNNEKFEAEVGVGIIGTDITLEGPFKKGYGGSFLVNYRYSTATLLTDIGLVDIDGLFKFQDMNMKMVFPTRKMGIFSLFSIGGMDDCEIEDVTPSIMLSPSKDTKIISDIREDYNKENYLLNSGISHVLSLNDYSFIRTTLSYSGSGINDDKYQLKRIGSWSNTGEFIADTVFDKTLSYKNRFSRSVYRGTVKYSNKINAKNKIQAGFNYALHYYDFQQSHLNDDASTMFTVVDFNKGIHTLQSFISWKYRLNENVTIVSGIHNMNVFLNKESTIEPRVAINWKLNATNSIHAGYGNHSTMESIHHYFAKVEQEDGSIIEPNKDLGLLKAHHFVLGYEKRFSDNLMVKIEAYYQDLYNLPVENNDTSFFATINEGLDYRYVNLVNKGTGKNYGVELTIERFFNSSYYFLINTTLYNSTYKALDGIERNTQFNKNYLANVIFGKEFHNLGRKNNQILGLNVKAFFQGKQKQVMLLRNSNGDLAVDPGNNKFYDYEHAFEEGLDDIYQVNLSISYKFNKKKTTHEIFLDLQNLTNSKGRLYEYYDESESDSIGYQTQFGFFPNLMYRVYF